MSAVIDLNADLGEGGQFDSELLALVSSANISCGAHAGSEHDIQHAICHALQNNVSIGAHPSYPDRKNRGRRTVIMPAAELRNSLLEQLHWLDTRVRDAGGRLQHVKPHGALYNDAVQDQQLAALVAQCVCDFNPALTLIGLSGGALLQAGRAAGLRVCAEAFVDRRYQADGRLVPRTHQRALITDADEALAQALCLITGRPVTAIDGSSLTIAAETLCIHGDSAQALEFAQTLSTHLSAHNISIR